MKRSLPAALVLLLVLLVLAAPAMAGGGLEGFLGDLNVQARADMNGFSVKVAAQFGVPVAQVHAVIGTVPTPADAFMVFQLGQMAHRPPETVVQVYGRQKGKGWGVIAKELGIKPGSREFHALKNGDLVFTGEPGGGGHGKGKGKGKGKKG